MPLKKLDDDKTWNRKVCRSPEHKPPSMLYLEDGTYEYTCPACGASVTFTVSHPTLGTVTRTWAKRQLIGSPWRSMVGRLSS